MKFDNQLRYALQIIDLYQGDMPLHTWLKSYFRENRQMGARDRRLLGTLVYGFYRLGHAARDLPVEERVLAALFLCHAQPSEFLQYFKPAYNERIAGSPDEKIRFFQTQPAGAGFRVTDIFPWKEELSVGIDHEAFCVSFLHQPDLFLRIRPGQESAVRQRLPQPYEFIPPSTLRLPNGFKVEDFFTPDKEVVIQDYSSQRIASFLQWPPTPGFVPSFWDACAASGGKSILAHDLYPEMPITVSDIRESILQNLQRRFAQAGIRGYRSFVVDLTLAPFDDSLLPYQLILADVPCSGSGTWGRTPEELYFFDPKKILHYSALQKKIVSHIAPRLTKDARLVYTTCSVFKKENEEVAALIRDAFGLQQEGLENIKGYDRKADSLFAARFKG